MIEIKNYLRNIIESGLNPIGKVESCGDVKVNAVIKVRKENEDWQNITIASIYDMVCDIEGNIFIQRRTPPLRNKYSVHKNELSKFLWKPRVGQTTMIKERGKKIYRVVYMCATIVIAMDGRIYIL